MLADPWCICAAIVGFDDLCVRSWMFPGEEGQSGVPG